MFWRALVSFFAIALISLAFTGCSSDGDSSQSDDVNQLEDVTDSGESDTAPDSDADTPQTCWSCHGSEDSPNPPPDLSGSSDRADDGVGAHAQHLGESDWRAQIYCMHCHPVPETIDEAGHLDNERPADVVFHGLSVAQMEPGREGETCSVYCHGGAMHDESRLSPEWTSQTPMVCGDCHGMPPAAPHPESDQCSDCHIDVIDEDGQIFRPSAHMNAELLAPHHAHLVHLGGAGGIAYECTTCHNGDRYHGPLIDGNYIDDTTICENCHAAGTVSADDWLEYVWPSTSER